ncbi:peptidylprolyl isomerase [Kordiimonas sp.]|uniref:peptidylprolyl isomerase n=1 Tax=Kordiimonas sp. TaxID=1970157 RepID=UPI003A95488E
MKLKHAAVAGLLTFSNAAPILAWQKNDEVNKFNGLNAEMLAATDARDALNQVFDDALARENYQALVYLGQIGGEACAKLAPYLTAQDVHARAAARKGAMLCHDTELSDALLAFPEALPATAGDDYLYPAFGFSGGPAARKLLVEKVNAIKPGSPFNVGYPDNPRTMPLFGLLQSVVYDQMAAGDIDGLDFTNLLALTGEMGTAEAAAYLLTRFTELSTVLEQSAVEQAISNADNVIVRTLLVRVLRQFGDSVAETLQALAGSEEMPIKLAALRAMGYLSDPETMKSLVRAAGRGEDHTRQVALTALGSRNAGAAIVVKKLKETLGDQNSWLATTALESLYAHSEGEAIRFARIWLRREDYYKAFKAMSVLSRSDEGKAVLQAYADANPETNRGREAAIALDPSIEAITAPRETPSIKLVVGYQKRELVLETTRGTICIAPSSSAPYAAANFMLLADAGRMDGMLWHRVIPNFVAQAGQTEDPEINKWGSIREEWFESNHQIGTVGVATAGRDTGGTQFFINTAYNMHLNGRYTVFGRVTKGLEAAFALEEGDLISKASTIKAGDEACQ